MRVDLTKDEIQNLMALCDLGVRQGGIQTAAPLLALHRKLSGFLAGHQLVEDERVLTKEADEVRAASDRLEAILDEETLN